MIKTRYQTKTRRELPKSGKERLQKQPKKPGANIVLKIWKKIYGTSLFKQYIIGIQKIPILRASKKPKTLSINLTKYVCDLSAKNKILIKQNKEYLNNEKYYGHELEDSILLSILPQLMSRFSAIPIKILAGIFVDTGELTQPLYMQRRRTKCSQKSFEKEKQCPRAHSISRLTINVRLQLSRQCSAGKGMDT